MKERRDYGGGPIRLMAKAEGYVMVRRPGCLPFILSVKEWESLALVEYVS